VAARQGELGGIVIEPRPGPAHHRVTLGTVAIEVPRDMVGVLSRLVVGQVAIEAVGRADREEQGPLRRRDVARLAVGRQVRPGQGESRGLVHPPHLGPIQEAPARVAACALDAQGPLVHVAMAAHTLCFCPFEIEVGVAGGALGRRVPAGQCQAEPGVIEPLADPRRLPRVGRVTAGAWFLDRAVGVLHRLLRQGEYREQADPQQQQCGSHHDGLCTGVPPAWQLSHLPDRGA